MIGNRAAGLIEIHYKVKWAQMCCVGNQVFLLGLGAVWKRAFNVCLCCHIQVILVLVITKVFLGSGVMKMKAETSGRMIDAIRDFKNTPCIIHC